MTDTPKLATGTYWVDLPCPRCGLLATVAVHLGSTLTTPDEGTPALRLVARSKPMDHWCGQRAMLTTPDLQLFNDDDVDPRRYPDR